MKKDLPSYDESPTCPKCGNSKPDQFSLCFRERARPDQHGWPYLDQEHLARRCRMCDYEWSEACVDGGKEAMLVGEGEP